MERIGYTHTHTLLQIIYHNLVAKARPQPPVKVYLENGACNHLLHCSNSYASLAVHKWSQLQVDFPPELFFCTHHRSSSPSLPSIVSLIEHLPPVEPIAELLLLLMSSVVHLHRHNTWTRVRFTPWRNSGELKAPTTLSQAQHRLNRQSGDRQKRQRVRLMEIDLRFDLWSPLGGTPRGRAPLLKGECIKGKDFRL